MAGFLAQRKFLSSSSSFLRTCIGSKRCLHDTRTVQNYWEPDRKSGYKTKIIKPNSTMIKEGLKELRGEVGKFKQEIVCKLRCDSAFAIWHGDYEVIWKFDSKSVVGSLVFTGDRDHNEGKRRGSFVLGPNKKAIFHGSLDTEVPKDGVNKSSGYCNIRSPKNLVRRKVTKWRRESWHYILTGSKSSS